MATKDDKGVEMTTAGPRRAQQSVVRYALLGVLALGCSGCGSPPEARVSVAVDTGLDDVWASIGNTPGWVEVRLSAGRAHTVLQVDKAQDERASAFTDLIRRATYSEGAEDIIGLDILAEYPPYEDTVTFRKQTLIPIARVVIHPGRSSWLGSTPEKPAEIQWNDRAQASMAANDVDYAKEQQRTAELDAIVAKGGRRDRSSFKRTGSWSAVTCAMSSESSIAGYRAGNARVQVFEKHGGGWNRTEFSGTTSGVAIRPNQMKCARVSVPHGGTFSLDVNVPSGVNYTVDVSGGGPDLRMRPR
jgi:hypothetical protein